MNLVSKNDKDLLNEADIKSIILGHPPISAKKPIVSSEYVFGGKARRADLIVIGEDVTAFEIKSDYDNLCRLESQIEDYLRFFKKLVIVTTAKHLHKIMDMRRPDLSIWSVSPGRQITVEHSSTCLPVIKICDISSLFTKEDRQRYSINSCKNQHSMELLETAFVSVMKAKYGASSERFWKQIGRRPPQPADLGTLSRFLDNRVRSAESAKRIQNFWEHWHASADLFFDASLRGTEVNDSI